MHRPHTLSRRDLATVAAVATAAAIGVSSAWAAPKTYKYRCPKCKLIQEYGTQGVKKCPNDGSTMIRQNEHRRNASAFDLRLPPATELQTAPCGGRGGCAIADLHDGPATGSPAARHALKPPTRS